MTSTKKQEARFEEDVCACVCLGTQMGYSHEVPDDAGTISAGSDALFAVTLDLDTIDGGCVRFHGLH